MGGARTARRAMTQRSLARKEPSMIKVYSSGATEEELTGAIGTTETGFTTMKATIPAGKIRAGDDVLIKCHFEGTGKGTAPNYNPNIRIGGIGGVLIGNGTGVVHAANSSEWIESWLHFKAVGASPVWSHASTLRSEGNTTFDGPLAASGKSTPSTLAAIDILPTVTFAATPNASDKITCRGLTVEIHRP